MTTCPRKRGQLDAAAVTQRQVEVGAGSLPPAASAWGRKQASPASNAAAQASRRGVVLHCHALRPVDQKKAVNDSVAS
jgi:hypothetical protein